MLFLKVMFTLEILSYLKRLEKNFGPVYLKRNVIWISSVLFCNFLKMHLACHVSVLLWAGLGPHFIFLVGIIQWESLLHLITHLWCLYVKDAFQQADFDCFTRFLQGIRVHSWCQWSSTKIGGVMLILHQLRMWLGLFQDLYRLLFLNYLAI